MLVQKYREYEKDESDGCFAVGASREEIFNDLKEYCNYHKGKQIFYYVHPVRPNKENYRPEYMMEIEKLGEMDFCLMPFWTRVQ